MDFDAIFIDFWDCDGISSFFKLLKQGENQQRMVILLQMTSWPGHSLPTSPQQLIDLVDETLTFWKQQRSTAHPILIHCSAGDGRSGLFCLVAAAITHLLSGDPWQLPVIRRTFQIRDLKIN